MKNQKTRKRRKRVITGVFFILVVLVIGFGVKHQLAQKASNDYQVKAFAHFLNHREAGELKNYQDVSGQSLVSIYYPTFELESIDAEIEAELAYHLDYFREFYEGQDTESIFERPVFVIDYNSYKINSRFVSLYFYVDQYSPKLANNHSKSFSFVVDLEEDRLLKPSAYFKEGYEQILASEADAYFKSDDKFKDEILSEVYQEGILANNENYNHIIIENDKVTVIFQKYQLFAGHFGEQSIEIPIEKLEKYYIYDLGGQEIIEEPIEKEPHHRKLLAFTFDDGPTPEITERILEAFEKVGGKATFFVYGQRVEEYPEPLKKVVDAGHQVGNHSYGHVDLTSLNASGIRDEIKKTNQLIYDLTGAKVNLVRPPYGKTNQLMKDVIEYPMINWNIDSEDWKSRDKDSVIKIIERDIVDNGIILMHDVYESTAEAVEYLLPLLQSEGYEFVTLEELAGINGIQLNPGEVYRFIQ